LQWSDDEVGPVTQEDPMSSTRTRIAASIAAAAGIAALAAAPASAAAPDTGCMRAGIATLKDAGLLSTVARNGVSVGTAVSLGVAPRNGVPAGFTLDTVIPFSTLLADHRAGSDSIFIYPWCG
jgi:hypothetical protein